MSATQSEPVKSQTDNPEDEIELIDILRIIWRWKYLIIIGTGVCALVAVIISFNIQPIYQISMMLKSGLNTVGPKKGSVYLDSTENFKTIIEKELLRKVVAHSKNRKKGGVVSSKAFIINADNYKNTLEILCNSTDREQGIEILNFLLNLLIEKYQQKLKYILDNYEYKIMIAKRQLEFSIDEEQFITSKLIDIQKRIDRYTREIGPLNGSYESHSKSQNRLLNYSFIIEKIADLKRKHAQAGWQTDFYNKEIADLGKEKISKQAILVAQPPTASQHPIKPKKKLIVILATMVGLFVMLFISFFIEYIISRNKMQKTSKTG